MTNGYIISLHLTFDSLIFYYLYILIYFFFIFFLLYFIIHFNIIYNIYVIYLTIDFIVDQ
jgi:hypothetical protein